MDLELTDEQQWLSEAVETLLARVWPGARARGTAGVTPTRCGRRSSRSARSAWIATRGSAPSSCAWCRGRSAPHLACAPYVGSAALRFAAEPLADRLPEEYAQLVAGRRRRLRRPARAGTRMVGLRCCRRHSGRAGCTAARWRSSMPNRSIDSPSSRPSAARPGLVLLTRRRARRRRHLAAGVRLARCR